MLFYIQLIKKFLLLLSCIVSIAGCSSLINKSNSANKTDNVNLDEKPEILNVSSAVIWDGDQTLGGIWVSHPDVETPERVLIKNVSNGKSIVGAIFQQTKKKSGVSFRCCQGYLKGLRGGLATPRRFQVYLGLNYS